MSKDEAVVSRKRPRDDTDGNTVWHRKAMKGDVRALLHLFLLDWQQDNLTYLEKLRKHLAQCSKDDNLFYLYKQALDKQALVSERLPSFAQENADHINPLAAAVISGKILAIELFLFVIKVIKKSPQPLPGILRSSQGGKTLYHYAAEHDQVDTLKFLDTYEKNFPTDVCTIYVEDDKGYPPIIGAITSKSTNAFLWFLTKDPTLLLWKHKNGILTLQSFLPQSESFSSERPPTDKIGEADEEDETTSPQNSAPEEQKRAVNILPEDSIPTSPPVPIEDCQSSLTYPSSSPYSLLGMGFTGRVNPSKKEKDDVKFTAIPSTPARYVGRKGITGVKEKFKECFDRVESLLDNKNIQTTLKSFPEDLHKLMEFILENDFRDENKDVGSSIKKAMYKFLCAIISSGNVRLFDEFMEKNVTIIGKVYEGGFNFLEMTDTEGNTLAHLTAFHGHIPILIRILKLEWESQHKHELPALKSQASDLETKALFDVHAPWVTHLLQWKPMQIADSYTPVLHFENHKGLVPRLCVNKDKHPQMLRFIEDVETYSRIFSEYDMADGELGESVAGYQSRLSVQGMEPPLSVSSNSASLLASLSSGRKTQTPSLEVSTLTPF